MKNLGLRIGMTGVVGVAMLIASYASPLLPASSAAALVLPTRIPLVTTATSVPTQTAGTRTVELPPECKWSEVTGYTPYKGSEKPFWLFILNLRAQDAGATHVKGCVVAYFASKVQPFNPIDTAPHQYETIPCVRNLRRGTISCSINFEQTLQAINAKAHRNDLGTPAPPSETVTFKQDLNDPAHYVDYDRFAIFVSGAVSVQTRCMRSFPLVSYAKGALSVSAEMQLDKFKQSVSTRLKTKTKRDATRQTEVQVPLPCSTVEGRRCTTLANFGVHLFLNNAPNSLSAGLYNTITNTFGLAETPDYYGVTPEDTTPMRMRFPESGKFVIREFVGNVKHPDFRTEVLIVDPTGEGSPPTAPPIG